MIIGNSMDAKTLHIYKNVEYPFDNIEVDWLNKECLSDKADDEENYEFLRELIVPCVEDDWHGALAFDSREIGLLIECDYCGDKYETSQRTRYTRESSYRATLVKAGYGIEYGESLLYKDNCDKCLNTKKRDTMMLTKGYYHFSESEGFADMIREVHKDTGFIKTSRGQRYIAKLLDAELNVLVDFYYADMILDDKTVIEYDGGGHNLSVLRGDITQEEFDAKENSRSGYLFSKGYKLIRFISHQELFPEDEEYTKQIICNAISELYLTDEREIHITMNTRVDDVTHGKLKPIKRILESSEWGEDIL